MKIQTDNSTFAWSLFYLMMSLTVFGSICSLQVNAQKAEGEYFNSAIRTKQVDKTQKINSANERDRKLELAIINHDPSYKELFPKFSSIPKYAYKKIDLNGDKKPEIIVHLTGIPFCGTGGCTTLIFTKVANEYKLLSEIGLNRAPIIVSNNKTNGWNDLIIGQFQGSFRGLHGYYALKFDGRTYPENPGSNGTKLPQKAKLTGRRLFESGASFELRP
jgi:hypothetical protein